MSEVFWNKPSSTTWGANIYDEYIVCNKLHELKQNHDIVIVIYHGGAERFCFPTPVIRKQCHRMVDSGADIILTQHSHCIGCEEYYNGSYILHGQGNFIFKNNRKDFEKEPTYHGLLIELVIKSKEFYIKKHAVSVNPKDFTAKYDEIQDFSELNNRTEQNIDEKWVNEEFKRNKEWKVYEFLLEMKGNSVYWKIIYRYFPSIFEKLILKSYTYRQLLFLKYLVYGARPNETMYEAIDNLLNKKLNK